MVSFNKLATLLSNQLSSLSSSELPVSYIKDINTSGGQCTWCGTYGHQRGGCPLLR